LPGQAGAELLAAARDAFAQSLELIAAICAVVAIGIAVLAAVLLRHVPPANPTKETP
jgi:DHA2 family multidrug resistance protein-like MFS transporter